MAGKLSTGLAIVDGVGAAISELDAAWEELKRRRRRVKRGATLRPGADTPLWLALVAAVRPLLRKRGTKALLARELGLHRSQVTRFFVKAEAMPDAERTLRLIEWLGKQPAAGKNG